MALFYDRVGNSLPGFALFLFSFPKKTSFGQNSSVFLACVHKILDTKCSQLHHSYYFNQRIKVMNSTLLNGCLSK